MDGTVRAGINAMAERADTAKAQIKLRLREPLRAKLEAEAKQSGFSLNTEIVRRLENSLTEEEMGGIVFRDKEMFTLVNLFASVVRAFEINRGKKWSEDMEIFKNASDTIFTLFTKAPELFDTGAWPGGVRTIADQGALAVITNLIDMDKKVRADDA
jgi:hypothetical protein